MFLTRESRLDLIRMLADKGLTQKWIASELGIGTSAVSKFFKGVTNLSMDNQKKLYELVTEAPYKKRCEKCGQFKCICN